MPEISVLIVDDEPAARKGIRRLLESDPDIEIVGEARDGKEAVDMIRDLEPDLVFLDIQMPEMTGFDVIETVGARAVRAIVFVTAYDQWALRAFEVQALDYILKPFEDDRFRAVLDRAKEHLRQSRGDLLTERNEALLASRRAEPGSHLTRILVREGGTVTFVPVDTLDWIEAADYYTRLHSGKQTQLVRYTLNDLEKQLDPQRFLRIHRSAIVNVSRVKEIRLDYQNHHVVVLIDGTRIPLSRSRKETLEEVLSRAR